MNRQSFISSANTANSTKFPKLQSLLESKLIEAAEQGKYFLDFTFNICGEEDVGWQDHIKTTVSLMIELQSDASSYGGDKRAISQVEERASQCRDYLIGLLSVMGFEEYNKTKVIHGGYSKYDIHLPQVVSEIDLLDRKK